MESVMRMGGRKIVGFAILVEINGEKMLIFSDSVHDGEVTLSQDTYNLESDDKIISSLSYPTGYKVNLRGSNITLRREQRPMGELLLEDSQYQRDAIGRLLDAERDPD